MSWVIQIKTEYRSIDTPSADGLAPFACFLSGGTAGFKVVHLLAIKGASMPFFTK